jgi:hypothetical protein
VLIQTFKNSNKGNFMKHLHTFALALLLLYSAASATSHIEQVLAPYKTFLEDGTYEGFGAWPADKPLPQSRHYTFKKAFEHFEHNNGRIIVELGTTRSYVHGGHPACNIQDSKYWMPNQPENWDWGAGSFTRMAAEALAHLNPEFHTLDLVAAHISVAQTMTQEFPFMHYHVCSSLDFLRTCNFPNGIDLLYIDTGDMTPIEPTARLQLAEAMIIVERNLLSSQGIILIDDVRNQTPKVFGETSDLGKSKYSLPYFLEHGYEIIEDEYQVILRKTS